MYHREIGMRSLSAPLLLSVVLQSGGMLVSQTAASDASVAAQPALQKPSELLQPALATVRQTIDGLRIDKWKDVNGVRDETAANMNSIRTDLETTLPALLATADAAPGSVVKVLPVFRNVDALYDVLLRIAQSGAICAPRPQVAALEQAVASLETSRRTLGDRLEGAASTQEQLLLDTQAALRARPVPVAAPVVPAPIVRETPPAKPRKPKPKPKPKPNTDGTTAPKPATSAP